MVSSCFWHQCSNKRRNSRIKEHNNIYLISYLFLVDILKGLLAIIEYKCWKDIRIFHLFDALYNLNSFYFNDFQFPKLNNTYDIWLIVGYAKTKSCFNIDYFLHETKTNNSCFVMNTNERLINIVFIYYCKAIKY